MNALFLSLGGALILALFAALVGPHFVDWTAHRAWFEEKASAAIGAPVEIGGLIDLALLPTPVLHFEEVAIGEAGEDAPQARVQRFTVQLAPAPLLRGEIRVEELQVHQARIDAVLDEDGALDLPVPIIVAGEQADRTSIDRVSVSNSRMRVFDGRTGSETLLDNLNFDGEARTLAGPFKADGGFRLGEVPHTFRISTSRLENDGLRFKALVAPSDPPVTFELDATARLDRAGIPRIEGRFVATRPPIQGLGDALPWRLASRVKADPSEVVLDELEFAYGPEDRRAVLSGIARHGLGPEPFTEAVLSARQADVDRLFASGDGHAQGLLSKLRRLAEAAPLLSAPPPNASLHVDIGGLVIGGGVVSDLRIDLASRDGAWNLKTAEATLPGQSRLRFTGDIALEPGRERLEGSASLDTVAFAPLRSWVAGAPGDAESVRLAPVRLQAQSKVQISRDAVALRDLSVTLGDASVTGRVELLPLPGREGRRLDVDLAAARLDLDRLLPEASRRRGILQNVELPEGLAEASVALQAESIVIEGVRAEGLETALRISPEAVDIQRLRISRLGGASVEAAGRVETGAGPPEGRVGFTAKADDLAGLAKILSASDSTRAFGEALERRRAALAPLDIRATLELDPENDRTAGSLDLSGAAAGSSIALKAALTGGEESLAAGQIDASLSLQNPAATELMAQLGFTTLPVRALGPGDLSLTVSGPLRGDMEVKAHVAGLSSQASVSGNIRPFASDDGPWNLDADFRSTDLSVLASMLGVAMPTLGVTLPANLAGRVSRSGGAWAVHAIHGDLAGAGVRGDLDVTLGSRPKVDGSLHVTDLDLEALAGLGLGGEIRGGETQSVWSDAAFVEPMLAGVDVDVQVVADRATAIPSMPLSAAKARFTLRNAVFGMRDLEGNTAGGVLKATLESKPNLGSRKVSLRFRLEDIRLEEIVWRSSGRPVASGALTLAADLESEGRSAASLVAQAAGVGSITVNDGEARGLNPLAFASIVRASDAGLELTESRVRDVFAGHLAAGSLTFGRAEGTLAASAGVVRLRNFAVESEAATSVASARIDLSKLRLESEWNLSVKNPIEARGQQPPPVAVVFSGALAEPSRSLDVSALLGFLTVRAFEKEVERLELLQSEIMERERLGRELIRFGQDKRRREREAEEKRRIAEDPKTRAAADRADLPLSSAAPRPGPGQSPGESPANAGLPSGAPIRLTPAPGEVAPAQAGSGAPNAQMIERLRNVLENP